MRSLVLSLVLLAAACSSCNGPKGTFPSTPGIQYELTCRTDEGSPVLEEALAGLFKRVTDSTRMLAAVSSWESLSITHAALEALRQHPEAQLGILVDPILWNESTDPYMAAIRDSLRSFAFEKGQVVIENDRNPRAGRLGPNIGAQAARQQNNFIVFSSLKAPDGSFAQPAVALLSEGFHKGLDEGPGHLLNVYGDRGLYDGFVNYWREMAESRMDFAFREVITYSDVHGHGAYFFPSYEGIDPTMNFLGDLVKGIEITGSPAKVRLWEMSQNGQTGADALLLDLAQKFEADVRRKLPNGEGGPASQGVLPNGLSSSMFLLVDGPMKKGDGAPHERHHTVILGSHGWSEPSLNMHSNSAVLIYDKELYEAFEEHWRNIGE